HVTGSGRANIDTGFPVLDRLLALLAQYAGFDVVVALAPGESAAEVVSAADALGEAFSRRLRARGASGYGSSVLPLEEALAHVVLELSDRPLLASHVAL